MDISGILRRARREQRLSQLEVARRSHVSLATIQNIEAGRANPEWETLLALCKSLNLKFALQRGSLDWPLLAALGCPLLVEGADAQATRARLQEVLNTLDLAERAGNMEERSAQALAAWLWAIRDHYPSLWQGTQVATRKWLEAALPAPIKLRRLALSRLGDFL